MTKNNFLAGAISLALFTTASTVKAEAGSSEGTNEPALGAAMASFTEIRDLPPHAQPILKLWVDADGRLQSAARHLIHTVESIGQHGLDPAMYPLGVLIDNDPEQIENLSTRQIDKLFDDTLGALIDDLGNGIVDPRSAQKGWHRSAPTIDKQRILAQIKTGEMTIDSALEQITSQDPRYLGLVDTVRQWELDMPRWDKLGFDGRLQQGDQGESVLALKHRLLASGDLAEDTETTDFFDEPLVDAVRRFQSRHGLDEDGIVARQTLAALNITPAQRLAQMKLDLERLRWMPRNRHETQINVNIPEFKLQMVNAGEEILDMRVVTGKLGHETPVFSRPMSKVVISPTWIVPYSIAVNELLPLEQRNPGYLARENIDFYRWTPSGGLSYVPRSSLPANVITQRPFKYVLQQRAGDDNALGRIKFLFPNPFNVYLHDTQAKSLFTKSSRAYSHGCIRVADPQLLGNVILQMAGYDQDQARDLLAEEDTINVRIDNPIDTNITYYTSWLDRDGVLNFRNDVYNYNKQAQTHIDAEIKRRIKSARHYDASILVASAN